MIAHFWERLPQTPPRLRDDLHLLAAVENQEIESTEYVDINTLSAHADRLRGVMLYVPKAHRADVLAMNTQSAHAFTAYIAAIGAPVPPSPIAEPAESQLLTAESNTMTASLQSATESAPSANGNGRVAIDFLTGSATGVMAMVPRLLSIVHKKAPARQLVNIVMQLPPDAVASPSPAVRVARETDIPSLQRWRKLYKEERGILFDADVDAGVASKKIFVLEHDKQVVAVAKIDLELVRLMEIGGVYTFPEHRKQGFGRTLVEDVAVRIRALGKMPTLQVDRDNLPAAKMYENSGWVAMGELARVWLTG